MEKTWVQASACDKEQATTLANSLNIDISLATILINRGICNFDEARAYFRPSLSSLHDPFLMKDMDKAIARIDRAIKNSEKILIYGDYDVDGTTAVALAYSFFKAHTTQIDYYVPDRHLEGYGISTVGIDHAAKNGFSLIIALDCGIKSIDKIDYASSLGLDFIICDHHLPGEELPKAIAVLDPKRSDCPYPYKELSGCGIGFKLAQAYCIKHDLPEAGYLQYLDLTMVSIAADIVAMTGENRVLAYHGLKKLNTDPCDGLRALMEISGRSGVFNITDVVFLLAPRINAAGRMDHAKLAVKMLLCEEKAQALQQSLNINAHNTERKTSDQNITLQALAMIENDPVLVAKKTTVVYDPSWNKGVIGIVASRLTEKYYRPTIVLTSSNGTLTGSARSVAGFDLYEALLECTDHLIQFGGHQFAAGLTLKEEALEDFMNRFEAVVGATITEAQLIPRIPIDTTISLHQIDTKFYNILSQMAPFGPSNMSPIFESHNVQLVGMPSRVGQDHLKMTIAEPGSPVFECIGFGLGNFIAILEPGMPFSVCYTIEENNFRDKRTLQLNIKGIKIAALNEV